MNDRGRGGGRSTVPEGAATPGARTGAPGGYVGVGDLSGDESVLGAGRGRDVVRVHGVYPIQ